MIFKTEMHCHTAEASVCASENYADTVEKYVAYGYTTVVLTNHYSKHTRFAAEVINKRDFTEYYLDAYHKMKEYAGDRLNVILGAEVTLENDPDDYLLYGITEKFLNEHKDLLSYNISSLHNLCTENGIILIQAHPFRTGLALRGPKDVDGIEVFNGSSEENHNDLADMWANYFGYIKTSGSDHHAPEDLPTAGIITEEPITSIDQILNVFRTDEYKLIKNPKPKDTRALTPDNN